MQSAPHQILTSLQNPRIKDVVRLRRRPHRDEAGVVLIEGYRELKRALDNKVAPRSLFYCPELFQGSNEPHLIARCGEVGGELFQCSEPVFRKIAYRDRPEGLLALAPKAGIALEGLALPEAALVLVTEAIEKPGNLGTMLRSADAAGVDAVVVCDRCTDVNKPQHRPGQHRNPLRHPGRGSGLRGRHRVYERTGLPIVAATPDTETEYTEADYRSGAAIVVGSEQLGLKSQWIEQADIRVRIPMLGQCDSLNVAAAATILLYEAVRQRRS